jgi:spermidine/putrescine transport system substrate-binding protein
MYKRFGVFMALVLLISVQASGLTLAQDDEIEGWTCPEGFAGQRLSVYNWSTYVAEDTIPNFEAACGVAVIYDVYENNEAMLSRIREGNPGYDIIVPSDYTVEIMAAEGLLEPLDLSRIPNFANIGEIFIHPPYDPDNQYSVPYQWGTIGIGYNVNAVDGPVTSWTQMFEHDGPVAWLEHYRAMLSIGLVMQGYHPNSTNLDEIAEARDFLIENSGNMVAIAADDGQVLLDQGNVDMTVEWSGDIFQIIAECECEDFDYAIPEEGTIVWVDNLAIPIDAPNIELAHVFIDYILDAQVGADISNYTAYGSPNQAAIDLNLIDEEYLSNPAIYPPEEVMENLYFIQELPDVEQAYLDAWDEIVILSGTGN